MYVCYFEIPHILNDMKDIRSGWGNKILWNDQFSSLFCFFSEDLSIRLRLKISWLHQCFLSLLDLKHTDSERLEIYPTKIPFSCTQGAAGASYSLPYKLMAVCGCSLVSANASVYQRFFHPYNVFPKGNNFSGNCHMRMCE